MCWVGAVAQVAGGGIVDNSKLKGVVASLSDYNQELSKLSLHIDMASNLNALTRERALDLVGKLEQDLVFGGATSKEVIELLSNKQELAPLDKVRILMCYVATHPEKLDSSKFKQWQKLANLKAEHMHTLSNMEYLGVSVSKRNKSSALSFGNKNKRKIRKARAGQEDKQEEWELSRFQPLLAEVRRRFGPSCLTLLQPRSPFSDQHVKF
jgi:syntaxin-binding protein 1